MALERVAFFAFLINWWCGRDFVVEYLIISLTWTWNWSWTLFTAQLHQELFESYGQGRNSRGGPYAGRDSSVFPRQSSILEHVEHRQCKAIANSIRILGMFFHSLKNIVCYILNWTSYFSTGLCSCSPETLSVFEREDSRCWSSSSQWRNKKKSYSLGLRGNRPNCGN